MSTFPAEYEIREAIAFYDKRGWNWLSVVAYMASSAAGYWPHKILRTRIGAGRPRRRRANV